MYNRYILIMIYLIYNVQCDMYFDIRIQYDNYSAYCAHSVYKM